MFKNPTLLILALVMVVNALAYGIIIPLLYPYAARFGINPVGLSLLFASFSLAQFISTPIIGRLSDRYGRKPLLLFCLFGTGLSLVFFALATSVWMLFISRLIDGVTGGNLSVAQAIVADTTKGNDRAKAFGVLWAAFGLGFLAGPALGGLLSGISLTAPFWFAAALAFIGTGLGVFLLKETLPKNAQIVVKHEPLFNFKTLLNALFKPVTGPILLMGFLAALSLNAFIIGFQSFTLDVLHLQPRETGLIFALFGLVSVIMQAAGLRILLSKVSSKRKILLVSFLGSGIVLLLLSLTRSVYPFVGVLFFFMFLSAPQNPITAALLSERSNPEDQGGVMGINQSYMSLGQIVGPLFAGLIAATSIPLTFAFAGLIYLVTSFFAFRTPEHTKQKLDL